MVDITKVAASLGKEVCRALIGMHSYTGCDTVSAFAGKGKASALKILKNNKETQETFCELGNEWDLSTKLMEKLEIFTCQLYATKASSMNVNDLRYHLFCAKKGEIETSTMQGLFSEACKKSEFPSWNMAEMFGARSTSAESCIERVED